MEPRGNRHRLRWRAGAAFAADCGHGIVMPATGAERGMLLQDLMLSAGRLHGRRLAVVDGAVRHSYAETADRVRRAAGALAAAGLAPGAHVAILAHNGHRFFEAYFACALAGLVAVPVNTRLAAAEVGFILEDSDSRWVLAEPDCVGLLPPGAARRRILLAGTEACAHGDSWEALIAAGPAINAAPGAGDADALAHLCYTGGTTGRAKGVMLSHRNVIASMQNKLVLGGFRRDDVWLHAAPMFHQADSWACFAFTALGARHVFLPRFEAAAALDLMAGEGVTATQIVPTMILLLLDAAAASGRRLPDLRRILYGSAPMPAAHLARGSTAFGDVFQHIYGLTEAAGTVAATPWPAEPAERTGPRLGSCGQPVAGVAVRIADGDGTGLPADAVGRILVRGDTVMAGYWRRPVETAAALQDGWLDTGDLGAMDGDGFLSIVDRAKDMIISGGENVYSTEVEDALCSHPAVREAAVIGVADATWGEAVTAVVVADPADATSGGVDAGALIAHCRRSIAGYKCPKAVHFADALPRTPAGKIAKAALRRQYGAEA